MCIHYNNENTISGAWHVILSLLGYRKKM